MEVLMFLFGDTAFMLFFYKEHKRSEQERWERGIGEMPDISKLQRRYVLIWCVLQCIKLSMILHFLAHFPAQR